MKIITAPEPINISEEPTLFLAGGITKCPDWQQDVIKELKDYQGTIFNPRRANFDINDATATETQIRWEFDAINKANIFSIWFCNSDSDQPICMYELGRELERRNNYSIMRNSLIIGIEPGYSRTYDVIIQSQLVNPNANIVDSFHEYIEGIQKLVKAMTI